MMRQSHGFTLVEIVVLVVVVALLAAGAALYMQKQNTGSQTNAPKAAVVQPVPTAPQSISSNADLDQAQQIMDNTDIDGNVNAQLQQLDKTSASF